jgi:uncharacterized RDD family membrane protein YckC
MPCVNHPDVLDGLSPCSRCAKSFCIDCLVGRPTGWFCAACDAASAAPGEKPAEPPPAPVKVVPRGDSCLNHPDVLDSLNACALCAEKYCPDCLIELKGRRYCAGCKVEAVKDMQSGVSSTELPLAHLGRRFVALILDGFVYMIVLVPIMFLAGAFNFTEKAAAPTSPAGAMGALGVQMVLNVFLWIVPLSYKAIMVQMRGQTVGKMAMQIKVVSADGSAVTPGQAWIRALIESLLAGCCYVTYIVAFFRNDKCTIHDMAAKTRVVKL